MSQDDFLDNRDAISKRQNPIPAEKLKAGKLKGRVELHLGDVHHTVIYHKPKQDQREVAERYCTHLNVPVPPWVQDKQPDLEQ